MLTGYTDKRSQRSTAFQLLYQRAHFYGLRACAEYQQYFFLHKQLRFGEPFSELMVKLFGDLLVNYW